eukprot:scaffold699_cov385-Prasinococcus_capsulatus_cf.AAC.2
MEQATLADHTNSQAMATPAGEKKSVEFRRKLRHSYREFSKTVDEQKDELILPSSNLLQNMIAQADTLHEDGKAASS